MDPLFSTLLSTSFTPSHVFSSSVATDLGTRVAIKSDLGRAGKFERVVLVVKHGAGFAHHHSIIGLQVVVS